MSKVEFSDVQLINLSMLITIRDAVRDDPAAACCRFGLRADQAGVIGGLPTDRILVIVASVGQECLFPPRQDLTALLDLPPPLWATVAAARTPQPTAPQKIDSH